MSNPSSPENLQFTRNRQIILMQILQYDANAIQVSNVLGVQIGHIPRAVAAKLAPYLVSLGYEPRRKPTQP